MAKQQKPNPKVVRYSIFTTGITVFVVTLVTGIHQVYFPYLLVGVISTSNYVVQLLLDKEAEDRITLPKVIVLLALLLVTALVMPLFNLSGTSLMLATWASLLVDWLIFYVIFRK
ncbi:hypothetical protein OZX65_04005 [Leuconostocaceae bacterium ESL0723]|nr:hypothetical protein OZX65_04005 [Leuconostocaceae bacterium ESL0723]